MAEQAKLAVLIDADNAEAALIEPLLAEVAKYGVASVKRIYGDWTQPNLGAWKKKLVEHAIQPMQQFRYTVGKNATDSALIIDAMDLLYTGKFDGFCLVSSDSDFTRLATRLRESGLIVYGFGEAKTPRSLIAACDKFVYVEILRQQVPDAAALQEAAPEPAQEPPAGPATRKAAAKAGKRKAANAEPAKPATPSAPGSATKPIDRAVIALLRAALDACADESGWAALGQMGQYISKQRPDFDSRSYGKKRLSDLVKAVDSFVTEARAGADGKLTAIYVHRK